jgi:hypothetical protein
MFFASTLLSGTVIFSLVLLLGPLHISLTGGIYLSLIVTASVLIMRRKELSKIIRGIGSDLSIAFFSFFAVILVRSIPMLFHLAPAGAVSAQKALIASRLIADDGIRDLLTSHAPISIFTAVISLITGISLVRSMFFVSCLSMALVTIFSYLLLNKWFERRISLFSAIAASFLLPYPQMLLNRGDTSEILCIAFLVLFVAAMMNMAFIRTLPGAFYLSILTVLIALFGPRTVIALVPATAMYILFVFTLAFAYKRSGEDRVIVILIVMLSIASFAYFYLAKDRSSYLLTKDSAKAFVWMDRTLNKNAVILVDPGTAGAWTQALTGRKTVFSYKSRAAGYIYVDTSFSEAPLFKRVQERPYLYRRVFSNPEAQVWKVL